MKRCIITDFIEKEATVNSISKLKLLRQYFTLFIEWLLYIYIYIYIYVCVCVFVCACVISPIYFNFYKTLVFFSNKYIPNSFLLWKLLNQNGYYYVLFNTKFYFVAKIKLRHNSFATKNMDIYVYIGLCNFIFRYSISNVLCLPINDT